MKINGIFNDIVLMMNISTVINSAIVGDIPVCV